MWKTSQFYTGGLAAFTAVSATFTNLANTVPIRRDEGVLKRWRGTPQRPWVVLGGMIGSSIALAAAGVIVMLGLGVRGLRPGHRRRQGPGADRDVPRRRGVVRRDGHGHRRRVPDGLGGVGAGQRRSSCRWRSSPTCSSPSRTRPRWLKTLGDILPLKPFAQAFQNCFNPAVDRAGVRLGAPGAGRRVGRRRAARCAEVVPVGAFQGRHDAAPSGAGRGERRTG